MKPQTLSGLKWIVSILDEHSVPYRIGGGFAAHLYGSNRPVNDIDISMSGKYFDSILPEVREYITAGPKHYLNEKWDCDTLSLNFEGQDIDITDVDTLKMSNKDKSQWFQTKDHFRKYPPRVFEFDGLKVNIFDPRDLVAYKAHLDGEHQLIDIEAVGRYINTHLQNR